MLVPTLQKCNEKTETFVTETSEFIQLYMTMTEKEKQQIKGVLIGMKLAKTMKQTA